MKVTRFEVPERLVFHGQPMWSKDEVHKIMEAAGVALGSSGVPKHPYEIWRVEPGVYECRQGERG